MSSGEASLDGIPVRNAWYLLLYAWDLAEWQDTFAGAVEASPSLLGLLARVLASSTRALMRRHLARSFSTQEESIRGVRGRIDFGGSLRRLDFEAGRAHCTFPHLSVDTLRNRILRSTLDRLARDPRVDHAQTGRAEMLRADLRGLVRDLDGVALVPVTSQMFRQLSTTRNDRAYALPMAICALVHRLELPTEERGDHAIAALLRDEIKFSGLFELFVRNFWRMHLDEFDVRRERLRWPTEDVHPLAPSMETDATLVQRSPPHRRVIVDTKYYRGGALVVDRFGSHRFHSGHLYQLYAYLRTQEAESASHRQAEGILLYATIDRDLDERMQIQGHTVRISTVDLGLPWSEIHDRLVTLIRAARVDRADGIDVPAAE